MNPAEPIHPESIAAGPAHAAGGNRYAECHERLGGFETHEAALDWIAPGARVLDVGCSTGFFARRLVADRGCAVIGIEGDPVAAREAAGVCQRVYIGDLEDRSFLAGIEASCDVVFFGDVLEHLSDPRPVLRRTKAWLASGGWALCSVPNVAYWKIRYELLRGRFDYTDVGILDRTHLRFYTRGSFEGILAETGYRVTEIRPVCSDANLLGGGPGRPGARPSRAGSALARVWPGLFATQFLFRALPERTAGCPEDGSP